ncbi:MAG: peptide chain release factor 3 [Gemmatimonadales bacterium]
MAVMDPAGPAATEIARRRTFAIISHPDAGKTTLTEKLLLYGGAIHLAGSVKSRRADRHATSDWMALEQERGISVTSSVLQFDFEGRRLNLLDTPGHEDFSEDTLRTLIAADSAIMLLDNRKGVEDRTRQLFEVCRRRRIPIVTFVNKCDRPGTEPLQLLDDVEAELGIACWPATWPVFVEGRLAAIYDRLAGQLVLFARDESHGAERAVTRTVPLDDPEALAALGPAALAQLTDELALLDGAGVSFSPEAVLAEKMTPVFFGSALTNAGVELLLHRFLELAPPPVPRRAGDITVDPADPRFSGFVFKIQANMDPRHRDRIAFVRICSGHYQPGLTVQHVRTGRPLKLSAAQRFMAQERIMIDEAWTGDVIGIQDRGTLHIGDTLSEIPGLAFGDLPRFVPEHFARISVSDPLRRKHLDTGLRQLSEEGAAQVFYPDLVSPTPIVGAVGLLQFDVLLHRLEHEYGVPAKLDPMPSKVARWVEGPEAEIATLAGRIGCTRVYDNKSRSLLLFNDGWAYRHAKETNPRVTFLESVT